MCEFETHLFAPQAKIFEILGQFLLIFVEFSNKNLKIFRLRREKIRNFDCGHHILVVWPQKTNRREAPENFDDFRWVRCEIVTPTFGAEGAENFEISGG